MNRIVIDAMETLSLEPGKNSILLPTGDGVYVAIRGTSATDVHVRLASIIREGVDLFNSRCDDASERYLLRIAVHEHDDLVIRDINGSENIAGHGINTTARLLKACKAGYIVVGGPVYLKTFNRKEYTGRYIPVEHTDHHGKVHEVYALMPATKEGSSLISAVGRFKGRIGPPLTLELINQLNKENWVYHRVYGLGQIENIGPPSYPPAGRQVTFRFKDRLHPIWLTNQKGNYSQWL
ncbi:MAG: hypothetical protein IPN85_12520 [Flavobacteriales bacterium]|nr:hypothetical protein [Flavobacteriales bacterium]MBL0035967.1 hypothetical protein [Flavobacteriales bacterium]